MKITTKTITTAAVVGAVYAALTMVLAPISYGPIQMRISEALCVLPFFLPCTTWGLFIGCAVSNLISAAGVWDVIFGSLATLLSCLCIQMLGKRGKYARNWIHVILAALMPVVWNALIVGFVLMWTFTEVPFLHYGAVFWVFAGEVALGELVVMFVLGIPLIRLLDHSTWFRRISEDA